MRSTSPPVVAIKPAPEISPAALAIRLDEQLAWPPRINRRDG
jgi:hypothetical protein